MSMGTDLCQCAGNLEMLEINRTGRPTMCLLLRKLPWSRVIKGLKRRSINQALTALTLEAACCFYSIVDRRMAADSETQITAATRRGGLGLHATSCEKPVRCTLRPRQIMQPRLADPNDTLSINLRDDESIFSCCRSLLVDREGQREN